MTDLRHQPEQTQIHQPNDNIRLVRQQNNNQEGFFQKYVTTSNAKKIIIVFIAIILVFVSISMLLNKQTITGRDPIKMSDNQAPEIASPKQSSFRSYYYFKEILKMVRNETLQSDKAFRWTMEEKTIENITFFEAQKLFKVLKMIQLAQTEEEQQENYAKYAVQQKYLNTLNNQVNMTSLFPQVTNQYSCSSCYAFPVTATIQALYKKIKNVTVKLSQQQLIDCYYNNPRINSCDQGNMTKAFEYAMNIGLVQEKYYPYRSIEGVSYPCNQQIVNDPKIQKYKISNFEVLPKGACNGIQQYLQRGYPVATMINAESLSNYNIKKNPVFSQCNRYKLNHAVVIVGQTNQNKFNKDQNSQQNEQSGQGQNMIWMIRNSWGSTFGYNGYFYMIGKDKCGTCSKAIIPYLKFNQKGQLQHSEQMPQQI